VIKARLLPSEYVFTEVQPGDIVIPRTSKMYYEPRDVLGLDGK
jgi:hypothetical protein